MKTPACVLAVVLVVEISRAAAGPSYDAGDDALGPPDASLIQATPFPELDDAERARRFAWLDRALPGVRDARTRASLLVDRAELHASAAERAHRAELVAHLATLEARDEPARRALAADRTRHREQRAQQAALAIADYTEVACDPADRARDLACAPHPALAGWPRMAETLHRFAYLLAREQRTADALRIYRRLADDFPSSQHAAHAVLALAEDAFAAARLDDARALYARIGRMTATRDVHLYARYKLGWTQLAQGDGLAAFESFGAVARTPIDKRSQLLVREARKDLVRAYAVNGTAGAAYHAFERVVPGFALASLERLADLWISNARYDDARAIYRELARRSPNDLHRCRWQAGIADAVSMTSDQLAEHVRELEQLLVWVEHQGVSGAPHAERAACGERARAAGQHLLRRLDQRARRGHATSLFAEADALYAAFLQTFAGDREAARTRIDRARLARELAKRTQRRDAWQTAAARFDEALRGGVDAPIQSAIRRERDDALARAGAASP